MRTKLVLQAALVKATLLSASAPALANVYDIYVALAGDVVHSRSWGWGGDTVGTFNAGGPADMSVLASKGVGWKSFDITDDLKGRLATSPAFIRITTEGITAVVPEPENYAMLLAGLGLIGSVMKRRKGKQA